MPVNIHGKQYATVAERLEKLYDATNGEYSLESEIIKFEDGVVVVKATLAVNGFTYDGIACEEIGSSQINTTSYLENCQTSSWGRCLSAAGYLSSCEVASAEEVAQAIHQQNNTTTKQSYPSVDIPADCIGFGKHKGTLWSEIPRDYLEWLVKAENTKDDIRALAQDELDRGYANQSTPNGETEDIPF